MSVDIRKAGPDVLASCFELSIEDGPLKGSVFHLAGATAVERKAAVIKGNKFSIATTMLAMNHSGTIEPLGGSVTLSLKPDTRPAGTVEGKWDAERNALQGEALSTFKNVALILDTPQGPYEVQAADVSANISEIPPPEGTTYSHPVPLAISKGGIVIVKGKAVHRIGKCPPHHPDHGHGKECCKPPCCSVEAHGHCTCFHVTAQKPEQLVFVASHPGVASSPVGQDRVLAYETITNLGPDPVTVFWDGPPPTYEDKNQKATLLPGNSITMAVGRAVKVKLDSHKGEARGFDVISWCCPSDWPEHKR